MKKPAAFLLITVIILGTACAKEKPVTVSTENVKSSVPEQKQVKAHPAENAVAENAPMLKSNNIVIDYKDFPKDEAGKEIWVKKVKTGKPDATVVEDADLKTHVLKLKSDEASYYFQKEVTNIDLDSHGIVSWKWKVAQHPKGGDVRKGRTDDQAIQVLLAFEGKYLISYIWDPTAPVGYTKDSSIPFLVAQKIIVLQSGEGDLNKWFEIRRDIKADFKKLYGKEAPELQGVAIQINSQHTDSKCESYLSPIVFEKK